MIIPININSIIYTFASDELGNPRVITCQVKKLELYKPEGWQANCIYVNPKTGVMNELTCNNNLWNLYFFDSPKKLLCAEIQTQKILLKQVNGQSKFITHRLLWLCGLQTAASEHSLSFPNIL